ncbi:MAG: glycosyltransferase family 4 protein [Oculatellaceae cyanobacterium bins.114]|nr:glycosyltransferase family 4 protein [Oculatellaceae cyanobacterium bins.114]
MQRRGHRLQVVAPIGSSLANVPLVEISGQLQIAAQTQERTAPVVIPEDAVLANMWRYAAQVQADYDALINFAYDWLPFYLTPFFDRPIAHLVSMGSLTNAMDHAIQQVVTQFPGTIGVHSRAQADTFPFGDQCRSLGNGLDLVLYDFCEVPEERLAWIGRIAPEKGLEDAIAAAYQASLPLHIWGAIQDEAYWQTIRQIYPNAAVQYGGFLPTEQLQRSLGSCRGLLMTPKWVEAFGNVAIEALACGVPVITYRRGGPAEIVEHGKTGWLVEPDSIDGLVEAIARLGEIDRQTCRQQAEQRYSSIAMGDRVEAWLRDMI